MAGQAEQTSKLGQNRNLQPTGSLNRSSPFNFWPAHTGWAGPGTRTSLTASVGEQTRRPRQSRACIPKHSKSTASRARAPRITRRSHHVSRADGLDAAQGSKRRVAGAAKPGAGARVGRGEKTAAFHPALLHRQ